VDEPVDLPDKIFFKIGEVSKIVGAEPYVLRYWEKEFGAIRPRKSRGGQRLYRRSDVEALLRIRSLLRDEGFTISGARKKLADERRGQGRPDGPQALRPVGAPEDDAGGGQTPTLQVDDAQVAALRDEVERLTQECQALGQARSVAVRRLAAVEAALRQVRREVAEFLAEIESTPGET
jgi:DNA-binding transcriptional MerR regulator